MLKYAFAGTGLVALLGATAMPLDAATASGSGSVDATFSVSFAEGVELDTARVAEVLEASEEQGGSGEAFVDSQREVEDNIDLFSLDTASAGPDLGFADAFTGQSGTFTIFNNTEMDQSVGFDLSYSLGAAAGIDNPQTDLASGMASISLFGTDGELLFSDGLSFGGDDPYGSAEVADGGFSGFLDLGAGENASFELVTETGASASVIPVPAALPMLLTAMGGLVLLRRRQRAA